MQLNSNGGILMNILEHNKQRNDISLDVNFLRSIIGEDTSYLESISKLEEIHSRAWTIQLKVESMLKLLECKKQ